jgi:hypothetical protein
MMGTCPTCNLQSVIEIERLSSGLIVGACIYCDLPQEEERFDIYQNHCWNCGYGIDSRYSRPSLIPGMGYHCSNPLCGKDLTEWKLRNGLVTANQLLQLGGYSCYSTVTTVGQNMGTI